MRKTFAPFVYCIPVFFCLSESAPEESSVVTETAPADTIPVGTVQADTVLSDGEPVDTLDEVDALPVLVSFVKADYPDSLLARGVEGIVQLDLVIDSAGRVDSTAVINGCHPVLDSAAVEAAKQFRFTPAFKDRLPVAVVLRYNYRFTINNDDSRIAKRVNLDGVVFEKGTKIPLSDAVVAIGYSDTTGVKKRKKDEPSVAELQHGIPLVKYLEIIGGFPGQKYEGGLVVTQTDSSGYFSFRSLPEGTGTASIITVGHKPFSKRIVIDSGQLTSVKWYVAGVQYNEYEVVVYGKEQNDEVTHHAINNREIRGVPGFNGEPVKVVQALPGVARPVFGGNEIVVRGADNDKTKIFYDGIELPYLYHESTFDFNMYRSIISGDALKAVTFYPGGIGSRYGNLMAGLIDLSSRPARTDRLHTTLDINLKGYSLLVESPIVKGLSVIGTFRGNLLTYTLDLVSQYITHTPLDFIQDNLDFLLRFDYSPNAAHRIFVESIGAKDTVMSREEAWVTGRTLAKEEVAYAFGRKFLQGIGGWDWTISGTFQNSLRLGTRKQYMRYFNNTGDWNPEQKVGETTFDLRDELTMTVSTDLSITAGIDLHATPGDIYESVTMPDTAFYDTVAGTLGHYSAYLSAAWKPMEQLTVIPGIRYDRYPQLKYNGAALPEFRNYSGFDNYTRFSGDPSVRVSARYEVKNGKIIKASAGTYSQSPDSMLLEIGLDKGVKSEKGSQFTLGYEQQLSELLFLDVDAYFNHQWDLCRWTIAEEKLADGKAGNEISFWKNNGKARMYGLELMLRRSMGKRFFGWVTYSLGYSERWDFHEKDWIVYDYNVLNSAQAIGQWALPGENSVGVRLQYTDGYPYTPYQVQFYDATYFYYSAEAGKKNSKRHTPYVGIDLNYAKKWVFRKSVLTTYIEFIRVLHWLQFAEKKNGDPVYKPTEMNMYNYDYTKFEGIANFPMISFGIKWEF